MLFTQLTSWYVMINVTLRFMVEYLISVNSVNKIQKNSIV